MAIKLSSAFLIREFSAKKRYSLIDFLEKAVFRQMVVRIIWVSFFKLPWLSGGDIWETEGGKSGHCSWGHTSPSGPCGRHWHHTQMALAKPPKSSWLEVTGLVSECHRGFMSGLKCPQCGIQLGKGQGLLAGMQGQPGHCLNMVSESFQEKKKKSWKKETSIQVWNKKEIYENRFLWVKVVWSWQAVTDPDEHHIAPACPAQSRALSSLDVSAGTVSPWWSWVSLCHHTEISWSISQQRTTSLLLVHLKTEDAAEMN